MPNLNGHDVVDLGALKQSAAQRQALEEQRDQLTVQLLTSIGLQCPCGERIRGEGVIYFHVVDEQIPTPQGPQPGLNVHGQTFHSRHCPLAIVSERSAIARRDGPAGRVTWLDERRAARAKSEQ